MFVECSVMFFNYLCNESLECSVPYYLVMIVVIVDSYTINNIMIYDSYSIYSIYLPYIVKVISSFLDYSEEGMHICKKHFHCL